MKTALVLIDIQNDYFPGGEMELEGTHEAAQMARRLLNRFRERGLPVFHVQHLASRPGSTFFVPGTAGVKFDELVAPLAGETVVQKHFPNAFRETSLLDCLRGGGVEELVFAGMMTHMCVDATVRAAFDFGFSCRVAHDACATRALCRDGETISARQVHGAFLAALDGTYAGVASVEEVLRSLPP
jgi:nicotinamidase-related amidase